MGRPAKYSRERLQTAALAIVDARGLAGLSMRSLAKRLGTGPMTLYNHVADRADLDLLVVDAVMAQVVVPEPRPGEQWTGALERIATAMWRAVRSHPEAIPLILTRRSRSSALLDVSEALLAALARSGRSGRDLLVAFRAVTAFVAGFAEGELAGPLATAAGEPAGAVIERVLGLPHDRFPRLREIARAAKRSRPETEFREGLRLLVSGLATAS